MQNEPSMEVCKAQKSANVGHIGGFNPFLHGLHFLGNHGHAVRRNNKAQVLNSGGMKLAFFWFVVKASGMESFEDLSYMLAVLVKIVRVDEDVVQVSCAEDVQDRA